MSATDTNDTEWPPRVATVDDAGETAHLLHDFNTEFDTPSPGPVTLAARLGALLSGDHTRHRRARPLLPA